MHYTEADLNTSLKILTNSQSHNRVSAHYLVDEEGTIYNLVPEDQIAWHAGISSWRHYQRLNAWSIGIELVHLGHNNHNHPYGPRQMDALIKLSHDIIKRHNIPHEFVLGHSDIAPTRKIDPGEFFNWETLAQVGIGIYPHEFNPSSNLDIAYVQTLLLQWGYNLSVTGQLDSLTQAVLRAFQRHYRPQHVNGLIDSEIVGKLEALCHQQ